MSQQTALFCFLIYIGWLFAAEVRRRVGLSSALWIVALWVALIGSRPVSIWFNFDGQVESVAEAYDEGNPLERMAYFVLIILGLFTLVRRGVRIDRVIRANKWLVIFFLYWGLSVFWADLPFLALKRWIKDVGNIVMVLIILTETNPLDAVRAVFVRCGCLLIPLSVLFAKFYPELGRAYHVWTGEMMYTGVTTHKNSLGALVLVCGLFLMWDFLDRFRHRSKPRVWIGIVNDISLMTMTLWLLVKANSATTLASAAIGAATLLALRPQAIKKNVRYLESGVIVAGLVVWLIEAAKDATNFPRFDISQFVVVDILGRDPTLTTRTEVWPMLLEKNESILFGAGFNSFWSGERLEQIYSQLHIIQAHNGYLETYLNGGLFAILLLVGLLFSAVRNINRELVQGSDYASMRLAILLSAISYNFAEASFNKMTPVWFALLLVLTQYPRVQVIKNRHASASRRLREPASLHTAMSPEYVSTTSIRDVHHSEGRNTELRGSLSAPPRRGRAQRSRQRSDVD